MRIGRLKEISQTIRSLRTATFTAEEDLLFIDLISEIDTVYSEDDKKLSTLLNKYEIKLEDGQPTGIQKDKFMEAYNIMNNVEFESKVKISWEMIRKLKNENNLSIDIFKLFVDNFMQKKQ